MSASNFLTACRKSGHGAFTVLSIVAALGTPGPASARVTAEVSITGFVSTCGTQSPLLNESNGTGVSDGLGPITMQCDDGVTDIASLHAQARAHPDTPPDIAVVASTTGGGAYASAKASFQDFATFSPPFNSPVLDTTFSITSAYFLSLDLPTGSSSGIALVQLTLPLYAFKESHIDSAGSASGTLDTGDLTIANCPCTVEILGTVSVQGANGGGGTARDPFTIHLPEGWTYTLASEQQAQVGAVPEPSSLAMIGCGLAMAGVARRLRRRSD